MNKRTSFKPVKGCGVSTSITDAFNYAWRMIQRNHPECPDCVIVADSAKRDRKLGHFWANRWQDSDGNRVHEVVIVSEYLNRGGRAVFETILHEAAHAINQARGVKDCSASQYHNRNFRDTALEVGLTCEKVQNYGFALTDLTAETEATYARAIEQLDSVLISRIKPRKKKTGPRSRLIKAECACGRIIRASRTVLEMADINCELCEERFIMQE